MFCNSCGTENVDAAQFCFKCGTAQVPSPPPTSWSGSSALSPPPPATNSSVQGYGYAPNYSSGNYPQPYAAPYAPTPYAPAPGPQHPNITINNTAPARPMLVMMPKSVGTAIVLAIFFGPLGMLYSTVTGGLVLLAVNIVLGIPTLGTVLFITWPAGIVWAAVAANTHNSKLYGYVQGG
jgi:hypothetical protein